MTTPIEQLMSAAQEAIAYINIYEGPPSPRTNKIRENVLKSLRDATDRVVGD